MLLYYPVPNPGGALRISGRTLKSAFAVFLGLALTVYLLSLEGDPAETVLEILAAVSGADPAFMAAAFAFFMASQVFRAWRWKLLSWDQPVSMKVALPLNALHVGMGHLLPLRLADPALVGLFRHYGRLPLGRGAATVVLAKLLDLSAMGILVSCAVAAGLSGSVALVSLVVASGGFVSVFLLPRLLSLLRKPIMALFRGKFAGGFHDLQRAVRVDPGRRGRFAGSLGLSLLAWSFKLFMFVFLLRAAGVDFRPVWKVLVAGAVTDMTLAMPVHGLLGLGTLEAGWTAGFAVVGVTGELAPGISVVRAGFTLHLLWLFQAVLLMAAGGMYLLLFGRGGDGG